MSIHPAATSSSNQDWQLLPQDHSDDCEIAEAVQAVRCGHAVLIEIEDSSGRTEPIWVTVTSIEGDDVAGTLQHEPLCQALEAGQVVRFDRGHLAFVSSPWDDVHPDELFEPELALTDLLLHEPSMFERGEYPTRYLADGTKVALVPTEETVGGVTIDTIRRNDDLIHTTYADLRETVWWTQHPNWVCTLGSDE